MAQFDHYSFGLLIERQVFARAYILVLVSKLNKSSSCEDEESTTKMIFGGTRFNSLTQNDFRFSFRRNRLLSRLENSQNCQSDQIMIESSSLLIRISSSIGLIDC